MKSLKGTKTEKEPVRRHLLANPWHATNTLVLVL